MEYKKPQASEPDSENDCSSSVGSVDDDDNEVEEEVAPKVPKGTWKPCIIGNAPLDALGKDVLPETPFTGGAYGADLALLDGIDPRHLIQHLQLFWTHDMMLEMMNATNAYGNAFGFSWYYYILLMLWLSK